MLENLPDSMLTFHGVHYLFNFLLNPKETLENITNSFLPWQQFKHVKEASLPLLSEPCSIAKPLAYSRDIGATV